MTKTPLSTDLDVITDEIRLLQQIAGQAMIEIGIRQIGEQATLKQIANHVAPQFGISPKDAIKMMFLSQVVM